MSRMSLPWPMVSFMTSLAYGRTLCNTTDRVHLRPTLRLSSPRHPSLLHRLSVAFPLLVRIIAPTKIPRKAARTAPLLLPAHPRAVNLIPVSALNSTVSPGNVPDHIERHESPRAISDVAPDKQRKPLLSRKCPICHDTFSRPSVMRNHMRIHEQPVRGASCFQSFVLDFIGT
ncbi:hypothetical protein DFH06DRAFT_1250970 [Mycena polygramma]|nr:hypothetical protein DFH06DRAFT_1250970 [Mycena polygramma]